MTKTILKALFLLALIVGTVLIVRENQKTVYQKNEGRIFGTVYHITYQCANDLHEEILAELQRVDRSLSMFNDSSTISRINRNEAVDFSQDSLFVEVFQLARRIAEDTDGAFDITVAPLVNAWGFGFKNDVMPTDAAIDSLRRFVGYRKVSLEALSDTSSLHLEGQRGAFFVKKTDSRTMLDCSAIAKGFGCDLVARFFRRQGIENYMIEIGGEVVVGGVSEKGEKWRIGVTKPENAAPSQPPPTGGGGPQNGQESKNPKNICVEEPPPVGGGWRGPLPSCAFVPAACGLVIGGEVVKELAGFAGEASASTL